MIQRLGSLALLSLILGAAGCSPAEVKPPPEAIPDIPPGRAAPGASSEEGAAKMPGGKALAPSSF